MRLQQLTLKPSAVVYTTALLFIGLLVWVAIHSSPENLVPISIERRQRPFQKVGTRDESPPTNEPQASRLGPSKPPSLIPNLVRDDPPVNDPVACRDWLTTEAYRQGWRDGVREADLQFKKGRVTIYTYGMRAFGGNVDKETGLPLESIAGCLSDSWIVGRAAGQNNRVRELLKVHGDPPNSFKRWEKELFDLAGFVNNLSKTTVPVKLKASGLPVVSPDGRVTVRPLSVEHIDPYGGNRSHRLELRVESGGRTLRSLDVGAYDFEEVELFWGPKRSGFAVVRVDAGGSFSLHAFRLSDGEWLRNERVIVGKRVR